MPNFLQAALEITEKASQIPKKYFRTEFDIEHKRDKSPVTIADQEAEQFIREALKARFPRHAIFGEEFGREAHSSEYEWIIDPIDGTRSFVSGMPLYGMLLALLQNQQPQLGIVRMPELNEVYVGNGKTATLNHSQLLQCSKVIALENAIVYINEGEKINQQNHALFTRLCTSGRVMRLGYDCYPHALLAAGQVDLVIDYDLKPYDYFSLIPLIEGAGGLITDWQGQSLTMQSHGDVVSAATPELQQQALAVLNS
ncbi:MAG: inositol monophosphatase family protein [Gammaproteobacteria bacterium]|nr:inositol monophosphatase family protein [Gammaproteobacteria bacterium]